MSILLLDNYDSFTFNLYQLIASLSERPIVIRNDVATLAQVERIAPTHIVISPGPGDPQLEKYFGIGRALIERFGAGTPILGVCLGHQGIAATYGARIKPAHAPMHGKTSNVRHDGTALYRGVSSPFVAMRYHSLVVAREDLPTALEVTAETEDGTIMGIRHCVHPVFGVQFHPESIGTPEGETLLRNFLEL
jgi:anthranilate synthase/aminodeoxychorismate synthase-like glutamine amidotransferase